LNSVDLPTLGRPTIPTERLMWRIVLDGKGEADAGIAATVTPRKGACGVA
jgi:hypothetical protein